MLKLCKVNFLFMMLYFGIIQYANTQIYGLSFAAAEVSKDERTGFCIENINVDDKPEISFNIELKKNKKFYFGKILQFHIINGTSFDIVHRVCEDGLNSEIRIILNGKDSGVFFLISKSELEDKWIPLSIKIDLEQDVIEFAFNKEEREIKRANIRGTQATLFFGLSQRVEAVNTDVPPMKIKDLTILYEGKKKYHWSFSEFSGIIAKDDINQKELEIHHPIWLNATHSNWVEVSHFLLNGNATIAYDDSTEIVYCIGADSTVLYFQSNTKLLKSASTIGDEKEFVGGQSFYNPLKNKVVRYSLDDFKTSEYSMSSPTQALETTYETTDKLHHNKFVSPNDSILYLFGGYGQYKYSNKLFVCNLIDYSWKELEYHGDKPFPRYLAAMGVDKKNKKAYLLSGYGSTEGDQMVAAHSYSDFYEYDIDKNIFKKVYDFNNPVKEGCCSNSLVVKDGYFYVLEFPKYEFNTNLQLVRGNLHKPEVNKLASTIPFKFNDLNSYADLYYASKSGKLIAITVFSKENKSSVNIYTIDFPPNELSVSKGNVVGLGNHFPYLLWIIVIICLMILVTLIIRYRNRKLNISSNTTIMPKEPSKGVEVSSYKLIEREKKNGIYFYGDFQLYNQEGEDITGKFTPLLKELFFLVALESTKSERGISSKKLDETIWYDKSEKSAQNNRAVNMAKLRNILAEIDGCSIIHTPGHWDLKIDSNILYFDYLDANALIQRKELSDDEIIKLLTITSRGTLLHNHSTQWLDEYKSDWSSKIIDTFIRCCYQDNLKNNHELKLMCADAVFKFDSINEDALQIKCKSLIKLKKHGLAQKVYQNFLRAYKELYDEEYNVSFQELLVKE